MVGCSALYFLQMKVNKLYVRSLVVVVEIRVRGLVVQGQVVEVGEPGQRAVGLAGAFLKDNINSVKTMASVCHCLSVSMSTADVYTMNAKKICSHSVYVQPYAQLYFTFTNTLMHTFYT
jgi:hypothetical protein